MAGIGSMTNSGSALALDKLPVPPPSLQPPLIAYFNILAISRGKTVARAVR